MIGRYDRLMSVDDSTVAEAGLAPDERLINRERSWLDFNARVLELAADPANPPLERVRFCSIVSSNLDEFFMVRVAGLLRQAGAGLGVRSADGRTPQATLVDIRARALELMQRQSRLWHDELVPELERQGIHVTGIEGCSEDELSELAGRFDAEVYPVLTPLAVGPGQPFPYISGLSLSLGVFVREPDGGEERFARVKVPEVLPRFISVGDRQVLIPLEDVIAHFLSWLFPGMEIVEHAAFRVTRDADFDVSDEADDLLEAVESELRRRRFGDAVRVEVSSAMSEAMVQQLKDGLGVSSEQIYAVDGMLDLADLSRIADLDRPDLRFEPWLPVTRSRLTPSAGRRDLFAEVHRSDMLVHMPYDSFATSVESFVRAAAKDPDVVGMKTTVYRTSDDSALLPALIDAAEEGKQTVCLVELKARFDERRNIEWSRAMEQTGVHVVYGFANLKIHAKMTLVVRREGDSLHRYAHIGTGNYNAVTARLYEDFGLFTDDEAITADLADLFNHLTGFGRPQRFRKILAAPFNLRSGLTERIRSVARAAAAGEHARIRIKVNALADAAMVEELYKASQAGAKIEILARSISTLRPGVPGLSENITVRSVVGRFLEHSRLFVFEAGDESTSFLGSADLMTRNLDHRIEVLAPVEDQPARDEINAVMDALMADNTQAWELQSDSAWRRLSPGDDEPHRSTHAALMRRARLRVRRRSDS
ncbi:MAG: polyphosphate kinase [Gaiellales bacterium]|jgi:polyphosphate kinase|nr:polyphosphate kinase [Gaiellales bacterium]